MGPERWRRKPKTETSELVVNMLTEQEAEENEQLKFLYAASQLSSDI
jgi:hypothetical protein